MKTNVKNLCRNGKNSICFVIPKKILTELNLTHASLVKFEIKDGGVYFKEVDVNER